MSHTYIQLSFRPSIDEVLIPDYYRRSVYLSFGASRPEVPVSYNVFAEGLESSHRGPQWGRRGDSNLQTSDMDEAFLFFRNYSMRLLAGYATTFGEKRNEEVKGLIVATMATRRPNDEGKLESQEFEIELPVLKPEYLISSVMGIAKNLHKPKGAPLTKSDADEAPKAVEPPVEVEKKIFPGPKKSPKGAAKPQNAKKALPAPRKAKGPAPKKRSPKASQA